MRRSAERLQAFADAVRRLGPHFQEAVDRLVARLKEQGVGETAPKPGEPMPLFVLPDEAGRLVSLDTLLDKGPVAITFHRGHWCLYCRINTRALAQAQARDRGGGRADRRHHAGPATFHAPSSRPSHDAPFPILTDIDNGYAMSLNLAFWVGAEMQELMTGAGWDDVALARERHLAVARPGNLRRRHRRRGQGALHRSGLPQARRGRGSDRSPQERAVGRARRPLRRR